MSTLEEWIKAQKAKGYNDSQLEEHLVNNGFDKETVDKVLLEISLGNTQKIPEKKHSSMLLWLGISFLIVVVLVGGAYYFMQAQSMKTPIDNIRNSKTSDLEDNTPIDNSSISNEHSIDLTTNSCGNGVLEEGEDCDGAILGLDNESICEDFQWNSTSNYIGGNLQCVNCKHDFSECMH